MVKDSFSRRYFACLSICLLTVLASAPCINADYIKTSSIDKQVEITAELYEPYGSKKQSTIKLSEEDFILLGSLINEVKKALDNAKTKEETLVVFRDAVSSLHDCGLIPPNWNIERIQRLIRGDYQNHIRLSQGGYVQGKENENAVCLIAGRTNETYFMHFGTIFLWKAAKQFFYLAMWAWENNFRILESLFITIRDFLVAIQYYLLHPVDKFINFLQIGHKIYLGRLATAGGWRYYSANGWIYTEGLIGIKRWSGSLWGDIPLPPTRIRTGYSYPAVLGFSGLKLLLNNKSNEHFYIGCALSVKVDSKPPES
jgi:hypothetical protein